MNDTLCEELFKELGGAPPAEFRHHVREGHFLNKCPVGDPGEFRLSDLKMYR